MNGFHVVNRNPGHWDISDSNRRLFRIRGNIGSVVVFDERSTVLAAVREPPRFRTVAAAMSYITDILMYEHLASDGDIMLDSAGNKLMALLKD